MLTTAIITLGSVIIWAVTARALFRRLARNTDLGYWLIAILAISGVPLLPVIAFVGFIVRNPPLSQRELKAKTQALEFENTRLRLAQADRTPHDCRDYDESPPGVTYPNWPRTRPTYDAFDQSIQQGDCPCCWGVRCDVNPEDAH